MVQIGTGSTGTTIKAKSNDGPTLEKNILKDNTLTDYQTVAIGDYVTFELDSMVPNMDGYNRYYFVINDTLSKALEFDSITEVKVGDTVLSETEDVSDTSPSYELEKVENDDGTTSLTIIFKNFIQYNAGDAIKVTYKAKVVQGVISGSTNKNTNKASLTYSNNPNYDYKGDPNTDDPDKPDPGTPDDPDTETNEYEPGDPTVTTPEDTVYIYTAGINMIKVDANGNRLSGATFKIVGEDTVAHMLKVVPEYKAVCYDTQADKFTEGKQSYYKLLRNAYTADKYTSEGNGATISRYATEDKKYSLVDGEYVEDINGDYLKTTGDTPSYVEKSKKSDDATYEQGYVLYELEEKMEIVDIDEDDGNAVVGTVSTSNGVVEFDGLNAGVYTITETEAPSGYLPIEDELTVTVAFEKPVAANEMKGNWTYTWETGKTDTTSLINVTTTDGVCEIQVTNTKTHTLPSTGGIVTTIFYLSVSVIALGVVILLIDKKRMRNEND
jgi:fimbrial isopeptide formation D2 family protein